MQARYFMQKNLRLLASPVSHFSKLPFKSTDSHYLLTPAVMASATAAASLLPSPAFFLHLFFTNIKAASLLPSPAFFYICSSPT